MPHYDVTFRFRARDDMEAQDRAEMLLKATGQTLLAMVDAAPQEVLELRAVEDRAPDSGRLRDCERCRQKDPSKLWGRKATLHQPAGLTASGAPMERCTECGAESLFRSAS